MCPTGYGHSHAGPSHSVPSKPRAKAIAGFLRHLLLRLYEEGILTGHLGTPEDDGALEANTWASAVDRLKTKYGGSVHPWSSTLGSSSLIGAY